MHNMDTGIKDEDKAYSIEEMQSRLGSFEQMTGYEENGDGLSEQSAGVSVRVSTFFLFFSFPLFSFHPSTSSCALMG